MMLTGRNTVNFGIGCWACRWTGYQTFGDGRITITAPCKCRDNLPEERRSDAANGEGVK